MAIRSYGLSSWKMADAPTDGTMALDADLEAVAVAVRGTVSLVTEDAQVNNFYSEEHDDPEESIYQKGTTTVKVSIYDVDPETAAKVLGGTVTPAAAPDPAVWNAPKSLPVMSKSLRFLTKKNLQIDIPKVQLVGKINFQIGIGGLLQIDIQGIVQTPADTSTYPISWSQLSA